MNDLNLSDVLHGNWMLHDQEQTTGQVHSNSVKTESIDKDISDVHGNDEFYEKEEEIVVCPDSEKELQDLNKTATLESSSSNFEKKVFVSPPYQQEMLKMGSAHLQQGICYPTFGHALPVSSMYHQPFVSMVRNKKGSELSNALQRPVQPIYFPGIQFAYGDPNLMHRDTLNRREESFDVPEQKFSVKSSSENRQRTNGEELEMTSSEQKCNASVKIERKGISTFLDSSEFDESESSSIKSQKGCFEFPIDVFDGERDSNDKERNDHNEEIIAESGPTGKHNDFNGNHIDRDERNNSLKNIITYEAEENHGDECENMAEEDTIVVIDDDEELQTVDVEKVSTEEEETSQKSQLKQLLMQPVKKPIFQEYPPPYVVAFTTFGNQIQAPSQIPQSSKTMQFFQPPPQQHLGARSTPPPGFAQPYVMGMRPHEEETRQIMNLDNQQTHNSSPTSSWNPPYGQMTNLNAYQPRGPLYAPPIPPSMVHQNGPPGVVPTSNPYYPPTGPPAHHHMQPQAPMMAPGMHGQQQQQPYYNTQSPLTGTPPSMNYGSSQMPAPPTTNGSAPIFNFSKPRGSNEMSSNSNSANRRKKQNDLSSPRYNSNNSDDIDASVFPDMADFPLLDVVQSKAKKDAGRKPCRPHLCEQSRMLISRVCHFQREFIKRLPARHPLANSPFSKPDQWTSQIMGISLATVRKCVDMAVDEEVFTRCTDKNLVNLTPSERAEREELLSKLSTVFEDEKSLGAGTAGMTIAEYSPRRSYSNTLLRQSTDEKSSNSSFAMNGAEYGSSETTLLNLDDHSNGSKDFGLTPNPTTDSNNGGQVFEEIGLISGAANDIEEKGSALNETPKRGRPRKAPGTTAKVTKRKGSNEESDIAEDKEDLEKKTEDEDETNEETEKKSEELKQDSMIDREDDAASSEGTNRSETATPEPATATTTVVKKTRAAARRKNTKTLDEDFPPVSKKKRGSVTSGTAGIALLDDENSDHKMVTRARSRQP